MVLSKRALDRLPYNAEKTNVTWETCSLRKWLNEKFYANAFNKTEQDLIKTVTLKNYDNPEYNTPGGNDTEDKVFLLSFYDMINTDYGFDDDIEYDLNRACVSSSYAYSHSYFDGVGEDSDEEDYLYYWLRSPGYSADCAMDVSMYEEGIIYLNGSEVDDKLARDVVRPAIEIILDKSQENDE